MWTNPSKNPGRGQTPPHPGNACILGKNGPVTPPSVQYRVIPCNITKYQAIPKCYTRSRNGNCLLHTFRIITKDVTPAAHHDIPKQARQCCGQRTHLDPKIRVNVDLRICCNRRACLRFPNLQDSNFLSEWKSLVFWGGCLKTHGSAGQVGR